MKDTQEVSSPSGAPLNERHDRPNEVQRASTGSSCASIKNEGSLGHIKAKKRRSGSDYLSPSPPLSEEEDVAADDGDSEPTSDSKESTTSSVSWPKDRFIDFKGQLSPWSDYLSLSPPLSEEEDVAADDGDSEPTSDSKESTGSGLSFRSDESKDKIINFKGPPSHRLSRKRRTSTRSIKTEGSPGRIKAKKRHSGPDFTSSSSSLEEDVAAVDADHDTENDMTSLPADQNSAASEGM